MATSSQTINAIQVTAHGGPEVLSLNRIPLPSPKPDEVLIKVQWAGVNFIDTYHRSGLYPAPGGSFPFTLGIEAAGIIERLPTDPNVLADPHYKAKGFAVGSKVSYSQIGAFAEYASVPWVKALPVPKSVSLKTAAAITSQGLTVLTFIEEAYNVQKGDFILVHAAAGGLGTLFVQALKARGAHVIGTVSSEEKASIAKANGADDVILSGDLDNVVKRVNEITGGLGVHAVFDGVGKTTWEANFDLIRRKGTIVSVGNASGAVPPFAPLKLGAKNIKVARPVLHNYLVTAEEIAYYTPKIWSLIESGTFKPAIFKTYPFTAEGVAQSETDIASRKSTGKLLIKVAENAEE